MRQAGSDRVTFAPSPGDFPRGRPALDYVSVRARTVRSLSGVARRRHVLRSTRQCSAKGCRAPAAWQLRWNNPKLHTPEHRKTWLACDDHRESLGGFLDVRGFLREVTPFPGVPIS